jgi:hypothetical protein
MRLLMPRQRLWRPVTHSIKSHLQSGPVAAPMPTLDERDVGKIKLGDDVAVRADVFFVVPVVPSTGVCFSGRGSKTV